LWLLLLLLLLLLGHLRLLLRRLLLVFSCFSRRGFRLQLRHIVRGARSMSKTSIADDVPACSKLLPAAPLSLARRSFWILLVAFR
jgi:hypothetical protein